MMSDKHINLIIVLVILAAGAIDNKRKNKGKKIDERDEYLWHKSLEFGFCVMSCMDFGIFLAEWFIRPIMEVPVLIALNSLVFTAANVIYRFCISDIETDSPEEDDKMGFALIAVIFIGSAFLAKGIISFKEQSAIVDGKLSNACVVPIVGAYLLCTPAAVIIKLIIQKIRNK